jgi:hypothetical protein
MVPSLEAVNNPGRVGRSRLTGENASSEWETSMATSDLPLFEPPTEAVYKMGAANERIPLYAGPLTLQRRLPRTSEKLTVSCELALEWSPHPSIRFRAAKHTRLWHIEEVYLRLDDLGWKGTGYVSADGASGLAGHVDGEIAGWHPAVATKTIAAVVAHVPNMCQVLGSGLRDRTERWSGRRVAEAGGWRLTLDELRGHKENEKSAREGGYRFTHTVRLERTSGATFTESRARSALNTVHQFLSFVCGAWTAPMLAVGFDESGARVWEQWVSWRLSRSQVVSTWAPKRASPGTGFETAFGGFWKQSRGRFDEEFARCLGLYIEANLGDMLEPAIIIGQAGLELLTWVELVHIRGLMTETQANNARAHDRLRPGLGALGVPLDVPSSLARLYRVTRPNKWDFVRTLTEIRNRLVHPPKTKGRLENRPLTVLVDLWELVQRNLALALLRHVGYEGSYFDRAVHRNALDMRPVPWKR